LREKGVTSPCEALGGAQEDCGCACRVQEDLVEEHKGSCVRRMFSEAEKLARCGSADKAAGAVQQTTKLASLDGLMQPNVASQDAIKLGIPGALTDAWAEANKDSLSADRV